MDHKSVAAFEAHAPYQWRSSSVLGQLADGFPTEATMGQCLDALDDLPAGAMCADCVTVGRGWPRQVRYERGISVEEVRRREAWAATMIDKLLAEEAAAALAN